MNIRPFQFADMSQVISLWQACGLVVPQNDPERDIQRKLAVDPELFLVGLYGSSVVATVMGGYEGHRGWVNYLAVCPEQRGNGFGRVIMEALEQSLAERGCPKINLQVRSSNEAVIQFYAALGYATDDVIGMGKRLIKD